MYIDVFRLKFSELYYVTVELLFLNELPCVWVQTELDHRPVDCRNGLAKVVRCRYSSVGCVIGSLRTDPEETCRFRIATSHGLRVVNFRMKFDIVDADTIHFKILTFYFEGAPF